MASTYLSKQPRRQTVRMYEPAGSQYEDIPPMYPRITALALILIVAAYALTTTQVARADDQSDYVQTEQEFLRIYPTTRYAEAEKLARRLLALARRMNPNLVALDLSRIGDCCMSLGRYKEAIDNYNQALTEATKFNANIEIQRQMLLVTINNSAIGLGTCNYALGEYKEAIPFFEQAIEFNQKTYQQPLQQGRAMMLLATTYHKLGQRDKAHQMFRETAIHDQKQVDRESRPGAASYMLANTLHNWGLMYQEEGRNESAEPMLRRALRLSVASMGWEASDTANFAASLASVYQAQNRGEEAEPLLRMSVAVQEKRLGADHPYTLIAKGKLGDTLYYQGQYQAAGALYREMIEGWTKRLGPDHPKLFSPLDQRGRSLVKLGRNDEAEKCFDRALAICRQHLGPTHIDTTKTLVWQAWGKAQADKSQESFDLATQVLDNNLQDPVNPWIVAMAHSLRADHFWKTNDRKQAVEELSKSINLAETARWHTGGAEREQASAFQNDLHYYRTMVDWQIALGNLDRAFQAIEAMKARTFLDELDCRGFDRMAGLTDAERDQAIRREAELRQQLTAAEERFDALPDPGPNPKSDVIAKRRQVAGEVIRARDALYEHITDVRRSTTAFRQVNTKDRQATQLPAVQKLLDDSDLLLLYQVGQNDSRVMAIRKGGVKLYALSADDATAQSLRITAGPVTEDQLSQLLVSGKESIVPALSRPQTATTKNAELAALWKLLVPAAEREALVSGKVKRLIVIPDGSLALLPFETLIVSDQSEPEYLLDVGPPIAYASSATVLLNLTGRKPADQYAAERLLTLGDPAYSQPTSEDAVDRQLGLGRAANRFRAALSRLPYTGWESSWVYDQFSKAGLKGIKVTGAQATEAAIRQHAPGREIVHLACHGMADQTYGNFFGSLAVAPGKKNDPRDDGFLSMSEIYELDLTGCELAILSACETNYGPQQQGEGVWALSRGFLIAGARRVIASNWVVHDQAGATLVSYFSSSLATADKDATPRDYAKSLQDAKKKVRNTENWSNPFYWSSLVLVGPR